MHVARTDDFDQRAAVPHQLCQGLCLSAGEPLLDRQENRAGAQRERSAECCAHGYASGGGFWRAGRNYRVLFRCATDDYRPAGKFGVFAPGERHEEVRDDKARHVHGIPEYRTCVLYSEDGSGSNACLLLSESQLDPAAVSPVVAQSPGPRFVPPARLLAPPPMRGRRLPARLRRRRWPLRSASRRALWS